MNRVEELKAWLAEQDVAYYVNHDPKETDAAYDAAVSQLFALTGEKHAYLGARPSPGSKRVKHNPPMLSLSKETEIDGVVEWTPAPGLYMLQPKVDGLSGAIRYLAGQPNLAATRGDGDEGEDVTYTLEHCVHAPNNNRLGAPTLGIPGRTLVSPNKEFEVRGEFYIPTALWEQHFKPRGAKNPRNSAAGLIAKQSWDPLKAHLRFVAYRLFDPVTGQPFFEDELQDIVALQKMGFETTPGHLVEASELKLLTAETIHPSHWLTTPLHYDIDGVVIKHILHAVREELGETDKFPRWACAFKFAVDQAIVQVIGIEWAIGSTGACVPTYLTTPAELCGTTVQRATGHNFDFYQKMGAGIGDKILIQKAGEIIPQVVRRVL